MPSVYELFGASAAADLSQVLASPSPSDRLKELALRQGLHQNLGDFCIGSITWDKVVGKPTTPRMCDAFNISCTMIEYHGTNRDTRASVLVPRPHFVTLWDDPADDAQFRVGFLINMPPSPHIDNEPTVGLYELAITFIDPRAWETDSLSQLHHIRSITPGPSSFRMDAGHARFLPYHVISRGRAELGAVQP